ncbi:MAG: hypothetical protein Q4A07_05365 [Coriobacteriales bacterium]|nr:hypothetical protein [Coriobacteriales bacterium]
MRSNPPRALIAALTSLSLVLGHPAAIGVASEQAPNLLADETAPLEVSQGDPAAALSYADEDPNELLSQQSLEGTDDAQAGEDTQEPAEADDKDHVVGEDQKDIPDDQGDADVTVTLDDQSDAPEQESTPELEIVADGEASLSQDIEVVTQDETSVVVLDAKEASDEPDADEEQVAPSIAVRSYMQGSGWAKKWSTQGSVAGRPGKGRRLEALKLRIDNAGSLSGTVKCRTHVQGVGWQRWENAGSVAGSPNKGRRIEAMQIKLTGGLAKKYDVYYRVYVKGVGWLAWAKNGALAGSTGLCLQVEAMRIKLVAKGAKAPATGASSWAKPQFGKLKVGYASKVSGTWQDTVYNGKTSGTTGQSLPVRGLRMSLGGASADEAGSIVYCAHIRNSGWTDWGTNDSKIVSRGTGKYLDAVKVKLKGTASRVYDVWYRAHVQGIGWMGWTRNGSSAGSIGANKRMEAVQIRLVPKYKAKAPGSTANSFLDWTIMKGLDAAKFSRSITSFGGYAMSTKIAKGLKSAVDGIRGRGYDVGFIMMDLQSRKGVAYNCDAMFYGASSIKGPYIASAVYKHPEAIRNYQHNITEAMFYSWDYDYKQVLAAYGKGPMRTWCAESGVRKSIAEGLPWVNYNARELAKLWGRTYLLYQQSSAGEQLGKWSERPNISTIHATLGGKYRTRSKAGWIDAGGPTSSSVNGGGPLWRVSDDGGIVYAKNGAYVMAIMSSVPANHNVLNALTAAIDAAHTAM